MRPRSLEYNPALDGLRGIVIIALLLYHSGVEWLPGGFLSVSMFFTLSGFLITSLLLYEHDRTGRIDMRTFWARRFRRLMPCALLALGVIAIVGALFGDASQIARLRLDGLAALFYVSNWRFIFLGTDYADLFSSPSLVQHFWSLSIEEQFYLTFPLLAILCLKTATRRLFAGVVASITVLSTLWMMHLFEPDAPTSRLYFGTDTRVAEILVGALLAIWNAGRVPLTERAQRWAVFIGVLGVVGNFYFWFGVPMETAWLWRGGFLLYACTTAAIILGAMQPVGAMRAVLSLGFFPWLGKLSYGVYLYHFAFYVTLTESLTGLAPWPLFLVRIAATFALAVPSFYFFERPVRTGKLITGWRPWALIPTGFATVCMMLVGATLNPTRPSVDLEPLSDEARLVETGNGLRIMMVGDSVSFNIGKGMLRWARQSQEASVMNGAQPGCGVARGGRLMSQFELVGDDCDEWPEFWKNHLDKFDPDVVVIVTGGWDIMKRQLAEWDEPLLIGDPTYDAWMLSEFQAAVQLLSSTGAHVIWLTSPCLRIRQPVFGVWDPERTLALNEILRRLDESQGDGFELLDFYGKVCPGGMFTDTLEGIDHFRPDGVHFSSKGANLVADWLGSHILSREFENRFDSAAQ